ncbi:MAG: sulfur carrier protein ThiS [bacterium]
MTIIVNGQTHEHKGGGTLDSLLQELGANPAAVALMLNEQMIPRAERASIVINTGDRVEILSFMGGG